MSIRIRGNKLDSEISVHKECQYLDNGTHIHENIWRFYKSFEDEKNVYILLELCENLSLDWLLKRRVRLKEVEVRCYAAQIINALKHFKKRNVVHRDLKLGNLFLTDKMQIKVGDFGLAARIQDGKKRWSISGTPNYIGKCNKIFVKLHFIAPEVLDNTQGHSYEADLWALGVIVYTLLVGRAPFETKELDSTYRRIKRAEFTYPIHVSISDLSKNFINSILVSDPKQRICLENIMDHDFFAKEYPPLMPTLTLTWPPSDFNNETSKLGRFLSYPSKLRKDLK